MVLINDNSRVLKIGDAMPHFTLQDALGGEIDTSMIKSKVLCVIFTCNHCPYAQAYEQRLIDLANEFADPGVSILLVNSNDAREYPDDSFAAMRDRATEKDYPFSYCHDESQEVAKEYGALCTPHCFVFDGKRTLRYKGQVDDNWKDPAKVTKRTLHDAIAALAAGKDPPVAEANAIGCSIKWKPGNEPPASRA